MASNAAKELRERWGIKRRRSSVGRVDRDAEEAIILANSSVVRFGG